MNPRALTITFLVALSSAPLLFGDQFQITAGAGGINAGLCVIKCQDSPNLLTQNEVGLYLSSGKAVTQELLVLLVPDNTTDMFSSVPISNITVYNSSLSPTATHGTAEFATEANAGDTFGLGGGTLDWISGGFWGTVTSDRSKVKVGKLLGIDLKDSVNMANVTPVSEVWSGSTSDEFGIYAILVSAPVTKGQLVDLRLTLNLPEGTYIAGITDTGASTSKSTSGVVDAPVPEPMSILLLASVVAGTAVCRRFTAAS